MCLLKRLSFADNNHQHLFCRLMNMMKSFILCCTVASLCGCDVVPYGRDHAETEPVLRPLFRLGLDYERGTHDLDLGKVECVFEGAEETRDMARAYETNGWKVLCLTPDRLVVAQGESVVEVVRKVFVTRKRIRRLKCGLDGMQDN